MYFFTTIFLAIVLILWPLRNLCPRIKSIFLKRGIEGRPRIRVLIIEIRREGRLKETFLKQKL